jgi:monoamine oxidase
LSQFITGTPAQNAAMLDDAARIAQFQGQLDQVYPEGASEKTDNAATVAWANEPFTGGSYTVFGPGQFARFWPAFREGTARLRFAGEQTEVIIGYMDSAVRSGHRVANELGAPHP